MPMFKNIPKIAPNKELKSVPSATLINSLINFSKSLEVKKVKNKKVLFHLN